MASTGRESGAIGDRHVVGLESSGCRGSSASQKWRGFKGNHPRLQNKSAGWIGMMRCRAKQAIIEDDDGVWRFLRWSYFKPKVDRVVSQPVENGRRHLAAYCAPSTSHPLPFHHENIEGPPAPVTLRIWQAADAVCFDVDSTVCLDEGIDELGEFCGAGEAVAAWTTRAMSGYVPFEDALAARLALFKPSINDVDNFLAVNAPKLSPGIQQLIGKLQSKQKAVYLISGGFRQMIAPAAKVLGIPEENIFANTLIFNKDGTYAGFDMKEPTSKSGGKAAAIAYLKQKCGYKKLVMIGDGATDLEARQAGGADIFVCYGGVQFRAPVAAQADWCVLNFKDLIESL